MQDTTQELIAGFIDKASQVIIGKEESIRLDTEEWIYSYLAMAYRPLSDAELEAELDDAVTEAVDPEKAAARRQAAEAAAKAPPPVAESC